MKPSSYITYMPVTRVILNKISIGDLVKINDWNVPYRVVGVSKNYFVAIRKQFNDTYYTVVSKKPWDGLRYNDLYSGCFYCGPDDWVFGDPDFDYEWDSPTAIRSYLNSFEAETNHISERRSSAINSIHVKKSA